MLKTLLSLKIQFRRGDLHMPVKRIEEAALRQTESSHAVIHVGESGTDRREKVSEDDGKPVYLRRI